MTIRTYVNRWWINDPAVTPCPECGCPIQTRDRRMDRAMKAHYDVVHPGLAVPALVNQGAS